MIDDVQCTYCDSSPAPEEDHVVARQFFPPEDKFRGGLPKVPSCGECNRRKQRLEDTVAVYLQFGHASEASTKVLEGRVLRTLQKNRRLARSLKRSFQRVLLRLESGILVPGLSFRLDDDVLAHMHDWFCFVITGLYRWETGANLPQTHSVHLVKPNTRKQYETLLKLLCGDSQHVHRTFAAGELQYIYAVSRIDPISGWVLAFKSVEMFAVTLGPECPDSIRQSTAKSEWKRPARSTESPGSVSVAVKP